jgi:hypothetical protein
MGGGQGWVEGGVSQEWCHHLKAEGDMLLQMAVYSSISVLFLARQQSQWVTVSGSPMLTPAALASHSTLPNT